MAIPTYHIRPALLCLRKAQTSGNSVLLSSRTFRSSASIQDEAAVETVPNASSSLPPSMLDPNTVSTRRDERRLLRTQGLHPIGSRRRRAAMQSSDNIPFEQMPYQCFQEARKVLQEDRESKLAQIGEMRKRIAHRQNVPAADCGGEYAKKGRLVRMHKHLEELKILADINDPLIRKRFEDKQGDMSRPIYRHLADKKWREYKRLILMQRISQMHLVPDVLPHLDPTAEVDLTFGSRTVHPGDFVDSRVSEFPAKLKVQPFNKGERLVTVVVVDPDVPDENKDTFSSRCHFLAVNVPVSPTSSSISLATLNEASHIVHSWLPAFAQRGAPYHRLAVFVIQQDPKEGSQYPQLDAEQLKNAKTNARDAFTLRRFLANESKNVSLSPIGVHLFRSKWDEGTDGVMLRAGIEGANVEYMRKKPEKLPYRKKDGARYR